MMIIHFHKILNCYANSDFLALWQIILQVYSGGDSPCGWSGHYSEGRMVCLVICNLEVRNSSTE